MRYALQFVGVDDGYRTGKVGLLLNTVTYHYHLIKNLSIALQLNLFNDRAPVNGDLTILETYVANHECTIGWCINREITIKVGNNTRLCPFQLYRSTNERFALLIYNLASDLDCL